MSESNCPRHEKFETKIDVLCDTVHKIDKVVGELSVRVNGSIGDIEHHLNMSSSWRMTIVGCVISIALQIITFAYLWGMESKLVSIHEERINRLEALEKEAVKIRISNMVKIEDLEKKVGLR